MMGDLIYFPVSYKESGVDTELADEFVKYLGMSGYGAVVPVYDIKIVLSTDGVGTKVLVAEAHNVFNTIGIDLVAMCANDILCQGAIPKSFLDYYATGKLDLNKSKQILEGIQKGCDLAGCKLVGGETAEMPGVYEDTKFDLAGFAMGVVEWEVKAPKSGDYLVGLPSSGPHSNGFSLIRKLLPVDEIPLTPTHIYTEEILHNVGEFSACAHVTGGGIHRALSRILNGLDYELDTQLPKGWWTDLYERSNMELYDFQSVFNCGWGMILATENPDRIAVKNSEVIGKIL